MSGSVRRVKARSGNSRSQTANPSIEKMAMLLGGLVLLVLALPPFFSFPWLGFWLVPLAGIYLVLLLLLPRLWLVVLPLATVGLDITPLTGRFAFKELDLLFLVTLASGLMYGRYRFKVFASSPHFFVLFAYLVVVALGYSGWRYFVLPPGMELENPYYTDVYAYKVVKGMVWGIALVPMWGYLLAVDKRRAVTVLVAGMCSATLLLGLLVLWERETLGVILSGSAWYHWVSSLLDLSSSYRVTGVFSDMHTGGEAFDGVVLLLLPPALYGVIYGRSIWLRTMAATSLVVLAYVTLVGFTRATYATFAIVLLLYVSLTLWSRRHNRLPLPFPLGALGLSLGVGILAAVLCYRFAGSYGLGSYGALLIVAYGKARLRLPSWTRHSATVLALLLIAFALNAHMSSRWVESSFLGVLLLTSALVASYVSALSLFEKTVDSTHVDMLLLLAGLILLPAVIAFALGGYQIEDRVSRVADDLETRENHWRNVIESGGHGVWRQLFGNGVGSFPANYIGRYPDLVKDVGSYSVVRSQNRDVLRLGGGQDLALGQRVSIDPYTNYTVNVHLRAEQAARLVIRLCERNLIYASNFKPRCVAGSMGFEATENAFEKYSIELNSATVGERASLWRWPTVMTIGYDRPDTVFEIDAIDLSADGFNTLRNGSFKRGLDYWFPYNDFAHLPWHIKNTFLQVWYESGWLGLMLFLCMVVMLVRKNLQRHSHDSLLPVYTTGVLAICVFGLFGSPLDSARVSWIFYFFLAAGLAGLRVRNSSRGGQQRKHRSS